MSMKSMTVVITASVVASYAFLTGCGPKDTAAPGQTTTAGGRAASTGPSSPAAPAVKDLAPGNCTIYSKAAAVKLLGGVTTNNKALDIQTDGGTKIDLCSYLDLRGMQTIEGVSYAVVRYDSPGTAFAEAKKVQATMLQSANEQDWPVQSLTGPVPGAGQVLGGYGTKTDQGVTYTIAVVGTNVGPYLVVALGASSVNVDNAKRFALTVFKTLASAVG